MRGGYFLVYRKMFDPSHDLHPSSTGEPACSGFAWLDLISMARFEDGDDLKRGQLYGSARTLAKRWNWTRMKAARWLGRKRDANRIKLGTQAGRKASVITICNYDSYQVAPLELGTQAGRKSVDARSKSGTRRKNKEGLEEYTCDFDVVWKAWKGRPNNPKKPALAAYARLRDSGVGADELLKAVTRYWRYCKQRGILGSDKMMMAQTFFGPNERWKDGFGQGESDQTDLPLLNTGAE